MSLSDRIGSLRKSLGFSQAEFAENLGLSLTAYKNYEKGSREPPASVLVLLCTLYDVVPAWLLIGESKIRSVLDVEKTEICLQLLQNFTDKYNANITKQQQAKLFNIIYESIDDEKINRDMLNDMLILEIPYVR